MLQSGFGRFGGETGRISVEDSSLNLEWFERKDRCLSALGHCAQLVDVVTERGLNQHLLLRKTGIFYEDIVAGNLLISPEQWLQLIENICQANAGHDLSFLVGQRLLPGSFGCYSQALTHAPNLSCAMRALVEHSAVFFPTFRPRVVEDNQSLTIFFDDAFGLYHSERVSVFMTELVVASIVCCCQWLSREPLKWRLKCGYSQPAWREQYQVYCSENTSFGHGVTLLRIDLDSLHKPWPMSSPTLYQQALTQAQRGMKSDSKPGLIGLIKQRMRSQVKSIPSLEVLCSDLKLSPATLKRKLKTHQTSYQALCDLVRKEETLYLMQEQNYSQEQVAQHLNYYDVSNFRRSYRRWLGKV